MKKYTVFMHVELDVPAENEEEACEVALRAVKSLKNSDFSPYPALAATKPILIEETED